MTQNRHAHGHGHAHVNLYVRATLCGHGCAPSDWWSFRCPCDGDCVLHAYGGCEQQAVLDYLPAVTKQDKKVIWQELSLSLWWWLCSSCVHSWWL